MKTPLRALVVGEPLEALSPLCDSLRTLFPGAQVALCGPAAWESLVERQWPTLVVADLDTLDIGAVRRLVSLHMSVIVLASNRTTAVEALDVGAGHYILKPVEATELAATVRASARASTAWEIPPPVLSFPHLVINPVIRDAAYDGRPLGLAPAEFEMLHFLATNRDRFVRPEEMGQPEIVKTHVFRLRKKLAGAGYVVIGRRGLGYRFVPAGEDNPEGSGAKDAEDPDRRIATGVV